jgi:two-component system, chemotaxis family, protein-glutamate methylesterase/glutaminase
MAKDELERHRYQAIVIGGSSGGFQALQTLLGLLPRDYSLPVMVVLHRSPTTDHSLADLLSHVCPLTVKEAEEKEVMAEGFVYIAPANYHLLVERDHSLSLSIEDRVWYSRPAIDVLFETAADAFGTRLVGVLLTGANQDGTAGLRRIRQRGGLTLAQDPTEAHMPAMPESAIRAGVVDRVLPLTMVGALLASLTRSKLSK